MNKKNIILFIPTIIIFMYVNGFCQEWTQPDTVFESLRFGNLYLKVEKDTDNFFHFVWAADIDFDSYPDSLYYFRGKDMYQSHLQSIGAEFLVSSINIAFDSNRKLNVLWGEPPPNDPHFNISKIFHSQIENLAWHDVKLAAELNDLESDGGPWEVKLVPLSDSSLLAYWMVTLPSMIKFSYYNQGEWFSPFKPFPEYSYEPKIGSFGFSSYPDIIKANNGILYMTFNGTASDDTPPPGHNFINSICYLSVEQNYRNWQSAVPRKIYTTSSVFTFYPKIAVSENNVKYIFWTVDEDLNYQTEDINYSYSFNGKNWTAPKSVTNKMGEFIVEPFAVPDRDGNIHLHWRQYAYRASGHWENRYYYTTVNEDSCSDYQEFPNMISANCPHSINLIIDNNNQEHLFWAEFRNKLDSSGIRIKHMSRDLTTSVSEKKTENMNSEFSPSLIVISYPNPFNSTVSLNIQLKQPGWSNVFIFNINGQLVKTLQNNKYTGTDIHLIWDGTNQNGENLSSGIYWYVVKTHDGKDLIYQRKTGKLVLIR